MLCCFTLSRQACWVLTLAPQYPQGTPLTWVVHGSTQCCVQCSGITSPIFQILIQTLVFVRMIKATYSSSPGTARASWCPPLPPPPQLRFCNNLCLLPPGAPAGQRHAALPFSSFTQQRTKEPASFTSSLFFAVIKTYTCHFKSNGVPKIVKFWETESRMVTAKGRMGKQRGATIQWVCSFNYIRQGSSGDLLEFQRQATVLCLQATLPYCTLKFC